MNPGPQTKPKMRAEGAITIGDQAAREYARAEDIGVEEARRELAELAADANRVTSTGPREQWRYRKRSLGLDLSLVVERQRIGAVTRMHVVSVNVRDYNNSAQLRQRERRRREAEESRGPGRPIESVDGGKREIRSLRMSDAEWSALTEMGEEYGGVAELIRVRLLKLPRRD